MTWTTPTNVSTGTASSSQFNTEVLDNLRHLKAAMPLGRVSLTTGASTAVMATIGAVVEHSGSQVTITNSDTEERQYRAEAQMRFRMVSGTNGLYRCLIVNGTPAPLSTSTQQVMATVTSAAGEVGGSVTYDFTLAAGASQVLNSGCLRVQGGGASDYSDASKLAVYDLGRV